MILNKLNNIKNLDKIIFGLLIVVSLIVFLYTFRLSYKRYDAFEFGKFDLGNMSQIVWNTSRGHFMEVTDQFGSNMKRFGMSHVDWVLVLFAPIYWVFPHPMLLVFIQNLFIVSGAIPLYLLIRKYTKSNFVAFVSGLIYLLYPAHGFLLVWSEYHGVAHVAPLLVWLYWYLDKLGFIFKSRRQAIIFWIIFVVMLGGKEQVGFILGMFGLWVFLKNRKLGLQMFIVGMLYSFFCFLVLIPNYVPVRNDSVNEFIELINHDVSSGVGVVGDNFFLNRYTYLGSSYSDIVKNILTNPVLIFEKWFEEDKLENLNYMYAPFAYLSLLVPFWLIALPDYLIALMADVKGFLSIENQRVSLIISSLFVSYAIFISLLNRYEIVRKLKITNIFVIVCLLLTIHASRESQNPLLINGISFIENKIIKKAFSQNNIDNSQSLPELGDVKSGKIPENTLECREAVLKMVLERNPQAYSGPDALGAYTSTRRMNALFPAGIDKTEMFVTDVFDLKAYRSLEGIDEMKSNKIAVRKVLGTGEFKHLYSCDRMSVFIREPNFEDQPVISLTDIASTATLESRGSAIEVSFGNFDSSNMKLIYTITKVSESINDDTVSYIKLTDESGNKIFTFLDYKYWADRTDWENANQGYSKNIELDLSFINKALERGNTYKLFYGFGNTSKAQEAYVLDVVIE